MFGRMTKYRNLLYNNPYQLEKPFYLKALIFDSKYLEERYFENVHPVDS